MDNKQDENPNLQDDSSGIKANDLALKGEPAQQVDGSQDPKQKMKSQLQNDESSTIEDSGPSRKMLYLSVGLFLLTFLSTTFVGSDFYQWLFIANARNQALILEEVGLWKLIANGFYYSIPVMSILLAHELGHYLQCLRYGIPATPPLFIPLPISPLGTMGAVILQSSNIPNRKVLFDIAISGPLGGLLIALPLMFYALSDVEYVLVPAGSEIYGYPPIFKMVAEWHKGPLPSTQEIKPDGMEMAVWVGLLVTGLNLIPIGQLDGGHILYCLLRKKSHDVALFLMIFIGAYMVLSFNFQFILMFALIMFIGIYHPPTKDDQVSLGWFRIILGWGTLLFLFIGFTPNPVQLKEGPIFNQPMQGGILIQKSKDYEYSLRPQYLVEERPL